MRRKAVFFALGALIILLCLLSIVLGESLPGLLVAMLAVMTFFVFIALLTLRLRTPDIPPKVHVALLAALKDPDPHVREKAVEGLAELDVERSSMHQQHKDLDNALISALKDPDPHVREEAVEGLTELEMEESSFYHYYSQHNKSFDSVS